MEVIGQNIFAGTFIALAQFLVGLFFCLPRVCIFLESQLGTTFAPETEHTLVAFDGSPDLVMSILVIVQQSNKLCAMLSLLHFTFELIISSKICITLAQ